MKTFYKVIFFIFFLASNLYSQTNRGGGVENTQSNLKGKTYAMLIGVSDYENMPEGKKLDYADDDALLLQEYLTKNKDVIVRSYLNDKATNKDLIGREIYNLLMVESQPNDEIFLYFAGHGDVDTIINECYLLLDQFQPSDISTYAFNDALSLNNIKKIVNSATSARNIKVTFIADACHSGAVQFENANTKINEIGSNIITITSCQTTEFSQEAVKWGGGHGVFTYYLIQGLMGLADDDENIGNQDGNVDLSELEMYVKLKVSKGTEKKQTPVFNGNSTEIVAIVNKDLLNLAKSEEGLTLNNLATLTSKKSLNNENELSDECENLLNLYQKQINAKKFYESELDSLDRLAIVYGDTESKKIHKSAINNLAISSDGKTTATSSSEGISIFKEKNVKSSILLENTEQSTALQFSGNDNLIFGNSAGKVSVMDIENQKIISSIQLSSAPTDIIEFSNGEIIISTVKGSIVIWNQVQNEWKEYKMHKGEILSMLLHENQVITAGGDGKLLTFDLSTKRKSLVFETNGSLINDLIFAQKSNELIGVTEEGEIQRWNFSSKKLNKSIPIKSGALKSIVIDPFEKEFIISGSNKKAICVDVFTNQVVKSKFSSISGANAMLYDPIHQNLIQGEVDGSVSVQSLKFQSDEMSAMGLREKLKNCSNSSSLNIKIDGSMIVGLNTEVNKVLNALINNQANLPDLSTILIAKNYAKTAFEIGSQFELEKDQLEINLLLLEVFEILQSNHEALYPLAIEKVKRIEALDPKGAYVFNISALLYAKLKNAPKALEMAKKAEALAPKWTETKVNTGKVLAINGDVKSAEKKFKEVIQQAPNQSKAYTSLGELYLSLGRLDEAKVQLDKALSIDPGATTATILYQETMSQLEMKNLRGKNANYPVPLNLVFYRNYSNILKLSASDYTTYTISGQNVSIKNDNGNKVVRVSGPTTSAFLTFTSTTTGRVMGMYEIPVKDLPKVQMYWGKSAPDEKIDVEGTQFFYGYNPFSDPDLKNDSFTIDSYVVEFQKSKLQIKGEGSVITEELKREVEKARRSGDKGGVCVGLTIRNKQNQSFNVSACYQF